MSGYSYSVEGVSMNRPQVVYGNVRNAGLIDNPSAGRVEAACLGDGDGVQAGHSCHRSTLRVTSFAICNNTTYTWSC